MENKPVVVVTGASRGIGKNIAVYFAENGWTVVGTGRNEEKLSQLKQELQKFSSENTTMVMDVTNQAGIGKAVEKIQTDYGHIDVWINNAGAFMAIGPTWEVDADDWVNDVQTNLFGTFYCTQAVVPVMLEQNGGRIINVVGGGTIGTFKYGNGYGTSKTAIARLTENLAAELEDTSVRVFALDPGLNDTDMTRYQRNTEVGKEYLSGIEEKFQQNIDVPPHLAPEWAFNLASGNLDAYAGRIVKVYDDLEEWKQAASKGLDEDFLKLRLYK